MLLAAARLAIFALLSVSLAAPTAAQTVIGLVTDSLSGAPVPGAVVQLFAGDGTLAARVLSNARGEFLLRSDARGTELRVVRIGFRPHSRRIPADATSDIRLTIRMSRIQQFIDPVRVIAAQCRRRAGRESPVGLIDQVRAGLLTTIVSRESNPAAMRRLYFERSFAATRDSLLLQTVQLDSAAAASRSFSAVHDAEEFVRRGFFDDRTRQYFGPDAEVLIDARFAAGYCFRVMPAVSTRPHQVGLGFDPADTKYGRVDISGALWIDTLTRELRDIEFRYVGLNPFLARYEPGGKIAFRSLGNGVVVMESWSLYLVGISRDTIAGLRPGQYGRMPSVVRQQSGGQLLEARWSDGTSWRATLGAVNGRVRWSDGSPGSGLTVILPGTPYRALADSSGVFTIADVLPGTYPVVAVDPQLVTLGFTLPTGAAVTSSLDTVAFNVTVRTANDIVREICERNLTRDVVSRGTYVLARAMYEDGRPVKDVEWSLRAYLSDRWSEVAASGRTDHDGFIGACTAIERGWQVALTVTSPSGEAVTVTRVLNDVTNIIPVIIDRD